MGGLEARKGNCASQGEKAAIIKELRENGYQLKYLLRAMRMTKSTYYFEINKVDAVKYRNEGLMSRFKKYLITTKVDTELEESIKN